MSLVSDVQLQRSANFEDYIDQIVRVRRTFVVGILTRLHSECLTGDAFGSFRCDCQMQLQIALETIQQTGQGVLVYLRQEGRGIGLLNKLKVYSLQEKGLDTIEANQQLEFKPDLRDYSIAAQILADLGIKSVNLLTNNPQKIKELQDFGINV